MNSKRLLLAIVAGFVLYFGTDFLVHGLWLVPDYQATASLWRTDAEMTARMPWMLTGHLVFAATFVVLWAKGFAERGCLMGACAFGLLMGLFSQSNTLITYVVSPLPLAIAMKWLLSGLVQAVLLGAVTFFVYKPAPAPAT